MESRKYLEVYPLPVQVTITNAGVPTVEIKNTDKEYKRVVGFAVVFDDTTNLAGSKINIRLAGKSLFKKAVPTQLFTSDSSCPVNDRYYNYMDEKVDNAAIDIEYTAGAAFPAGDTIMTVILQCSKSYGDE